MFIKKRLSVLSFTHEGSAFGMAEAFRRPSGDETPSSEVRPHRRRRQTKELCIFVYLFMREVIRLSRKSGLLFVSLYLKQCAACLQTATGGDKRNSTLTITSPHFLDTEWLSSNQHIGMHLRESTHWKCLRGWSVYTVISWAWKYGLNFLEAIPKA